MALKLEDSTVDSQNMKEHSQGKRTVDARVPEFLGLDYKDVPTFWHQ